MGETYRTSALLFRAANLEVWQARHTWIFFQFCGDGCKKLDCTRTSTGRDALDLRGTFGFFESVESVTGAGRGGKQTRLLFLPIAGAG